VFQVDPDASGITIGAMISQQGRPISFFNKNLNESKRNYFVYDRGF
jgi:hypothetical protein